MFFSERKVIIIKTKQIFVFLNDVQKYILIDFFDLCIGYDVVIVLKYLFPNKFVNIIEYKLQCTNAFIYNFSFILIVLKF